MQTDKEEVLNKDYLQSDQMQFQRKKIRKKDRTQVKYYFSGSELRFKA